MKLITKINIYRNIYIYILNSVSNRFQYSQKDINDYSDLTMKLIKTKKMMKEKKYDIIRNAVLSDNIVYSSVDLLVKGNIIGRNPNSYYPLFICTFFIKKNIDKYVNLEKYNDYKQKDIPCSWIRRLSIVKA